MKRARIAGFAGAIALLLCAGGGAAYLSSRSQDKEIAQALTGGDPRQGPALIRRFGCGGCHTVPGVPGADGKVAPSLGGLRERVYIAGRFPNSGQALIDWIARPEALAEHSAMPNTGITRDQARDVAAYLYAQ